METELAGLLCDRVRQLAHGTPLQVEGAQGWIQKQHLQCDP